MGKTNIEYADEVSNPLQVRDLETGKKGTHCEKPDPDGTCKNCWAEVLNTRGKPDNSRFGTGLTYDRSNRDRVEWIKNPKEMIRLDNLNWRKERPMSAKFPGNPLIVFTNDTYDLFQPSISDELRDWVFGNYDKFVNLTLLVQTTYVSLMAKYLTKRYPDGMPPQYVIGMSAGTQKFFDDNVDHLASIKAWRRYVIFEPLLESVKARSTFMSGSNPAWCYCGHGHGFTRCPNYGGVAATCHYQCDCKAFRRVNGIHLVIIGGESGTDARPCDIEWIRSLAAEGKATGVCVLVKQLGSKPAMQKTSNLAGGQSMFFPPLNPNGSLMVIKNRKGGDMSEWPEDLRIREFPRLPENADV